MVWTICFYIVLLKYCVVKYALDFNLSIYLYTISMCVFYFNRYWVKLTQFYMEKPETKRKYQFSQSDCVFTGDEMLSQGTVVSDSSLVLDTIALFLNSLHNIMYGLLVRK